MVSRIIAQQIQQIKKVMLDIGDTAPDFSLKDDEDQWVSLDDLLLDGPLILYFYPADFTPGCTAEACDIRDRHNDIQEAGATIVGVSPQSGSTHRRFRDQFELPFPLLADPKKEAIKAFGVNGPLGLGVRRVTYLIDQNKMITNRVVADFAIARHSQFIDRVVSDLGDY